MGIPTSLMLRLVKKMVGVDPSYLECIERHSKIWDEIRQAEDEMLREEKRHREEIRRIHEKRENIRARCTHPLTTYLPDPAGGSDSSHGCDLCGKDL